MLNLKRKQEFEKELALAEEANIKHVLPPYSVIMPIKC
jgi:hypothetical protein